jgi:hypothetical protein
VTNSSNPTTSLLQQIASLGRQLNNSNTQISTNSINRYTSSMDQLVDTSRISALNFLSLNGTDQTAITQNKLLAELVKLAETSKCTGVSDRKNPQQWETQSYFPSPNALNLAHLLSSDSRVDPEQVKQLCNAMDYQQQRLAQEKKEMLVAKILSKAPPTAGLPPSSSISVAATARQSDSNNTISSSLVSALSQKRKFDLIDYTRVCPGDDENSKRSELSTHRPDLLRQTDQKLPASLHGLAGTLSRVVGQLVEQQGRSVCQTVSNSSPSPTTSARMIVQQQQSPLNRQQLSELTKSSELVCTEVCGDVPDSLFVSMAQMKICTLEQEDLQGKCKNRVLGSPGICCKYCGGNAGSGRYFPSTLDSFLNGTNAEKIVEHAGFVCPNIPPAVKLLIQNLQSWDESHTIRKPYGSRKRFFSYVWSQFNPNHIEDNVCTSTTTKRRKSDHQ